MLRILYKIGQSQRGSFECLLVGYLLKSTTPPPTLCVLTRLVAELQITPSEVKDALKALEEAGFIWIAPEAAPIERGESGFPTSKYPKSPDYLVAFLKG